MKQAIIYSLKAWLTIAALAPLVLMLLKFFTNNEKFDPDYSVWLAGYLKMVAAYSLVLLVPCMVLLLTYKCILRSSIDAWVKKLIFILEFELVIGAWALLGLCIKGHPTLSDLLFWLSLSLPSAVCIGAYKLKTVDTRIAIQPSA